MQNTQTSKMGTAKLPKLILSMSLPAIFSMLIQAMYNIVDSLYVAQLGENALAAVSLAYPLQTLLIAVSIGTGVGFGSLISRMLGKGDKARASSAATHGMVLLAMSSLVFAVLGLLVCRPFFSAFTNDAEVMRMGIQYGTIVMVFSFGSFLQIGSEKILQATGKMIYPMVIQLVGAVTNIILDPIFIFGWFGVPAMGVTGAAIATVTGQTVGMVMGLIVILRGKHDVKVKLRGFRFEKSVLKDIYKVGLPTMIMQSIGSVMTVGINAILSGFSSASLAVLGVYNRLQSFVFMPIFGLNQGLMPILGYNYGAKNRKRIVQTVKIGMIYAISIMAVGCVLFLALPAQLMGLFNPSAEMMAVGVPALRLMCLCFVPAAFCIILSNFFQATGRGTSSMAISILRQLVILLPLAYLFSLFMGTTGVWMAFPAAELPACIASWVIYKRIYRQSIAPMGVKNDDSETGENDVHNGVLESLHDESDGMDVGSVAAGGQQ